MLTPLAVVGLCYVVAGTGAVLTRVATVLLGPSPGERIAQLERRAEQLAERNRLARELHDSVGHALSVVSIQAGAARRMLASQPESAERALLAIEDSARAALEDLDHVLGLLREEEAPAPRAGLDHLVTTLDAPPKIIMVTTFENDDYVYDALRAGASGFLLKRARPEEIVAAVRTVAAGYSLLFPVAIRRLAARRQAGRSGLDSAELTEREAEVLRLMAIGLSNAEIAGTLFLGVQTVKTHVANVLAKLGARDRTQAVIKAYESGFIPT